MDLFFVSLFLSEIKNIGIDIAFENSIIPAWIPESSHKDVNLYKTLSSLVLDTRILASMTI